MDGTPGTKVKLTGANPYGVLVSPYVASGGTASVKVDYGRLKPRTTYLVHTNAYDGSLYETAWSPWAKFRIEPYVTFPSAPTSYVDSTAQTTVEFTHTDPDGSATATSSTATAKSSPTLADFDKDDCSKHDKADRTAGGGGWVTPRDAGRSGSDIPLDPAGPRRAGPQRR